MKTPLIAQVIKNPAALEKIEKQTFDICMASIVQNGMCIKYVDTALFTRREFYSLCEAAVKSNPRALKIIKKMPISSKNRDSLLFSAVLHNGLALRWISEQTPELCLLAVKQNPKAFLYVDKAMCDSVNSHCYTLLEKTAQKTSEEKEKSKIKIKKSKVNQEKTIDLIKMKKQTEALCLKAVQQDGLQIKYVWKQTRKLCLAAFKQNPAAEIFIRDQSLINLDVVFCSLCDNFCSLSESLSDLCFHLKNKKANKIPAKLKTDGKQVSGEKYYKSCEEAIEKNGSNIKFVNLNFLSFNQFKTLCIKVTKVDGHVLRLIKDIKIPEGWYIKIIREIIKEAKDFQIEHIFKQINTRLLSADQYYILVNNILIKNEKNLSYILKVINAEKLTNEQYFSICNKLLTKKASHFQDIQPNLLTKIQYSIICFTVVKKNSYNICDVDRKRLSKSDWLELCKIAIRKEGNIFYYLDIPSKLDFKDLHKFSLRNGGGLKYVAKQNYKQCLSVVKKNGNELKFVNPEQFTNDQYFNICKTAIEKEIFSLASADDEALNTKQYLELCEISLKSLPAIIHLINRDKIPARLLHSWDRKAIEKSPHWLRNITYSQHYYGLCLKAVKKDGKNLEFVNYLRLSPEEYAAVCKAAVNQTNEAEQFVVN